MIQRLMVAIRPSLKASAFDWTLVASASLFGFLVELASAPEFARASMDSGTATLLGSALGAGMTVLVSIWAVRHSTRLRTSALERLVGEAVLAIRDDAYRLLTIAEVESWSDNEQFAEALKPQLKALKTTIEVFGQLSPFSEVQNYNARVSIFQLERSIRDNVKTLEREILWVSDHHSSAVLENARRNVVRPALAISETCVGVGRDLGIRRDFPPQTELIRLTTHLRANTVD